MPKVLICSTDCQTVITTAVRLKLEELPTQECVQAVGQIFQDSMALAVLFVPLVIISEITVIPISPLEFKFLARLCLAKPDLSFAKDYITHC